jgi:hypothetical protein
MAKGGIMGKYGFLGIQRASKNPQRAFWRAEEL